MGLAFLHLVPKLRHVSMGVCLFPHTIREFATHTAHCDAPGVGRTGYMVGTLSPRFRSDAVKSSPRKLCWSGLFSIASHRKNNEDPYFFSSFDILGVLFGFTGICPTKK